MSDFLFTSESVSEGHPDKVADAISDAELDALLAQDPRSRVGAETLVKDNLVVLAGEITTGAKVDYAQIARNTIRRIGYTDPSIGFDAEFVGQCEQEAPRVQVRVRQIRGNEPGLPSQRTPLPLDSIVSCCRANTPWQYVTADSSSSTPSCDGFFENGQGTYLLSSSRQS